MARLNPFLGDDEDPLDRLDPVGGLPDQGATDSLGEEVLQEAVSNRDQWADLESDTAEPVGSPAMMTTDQQMDDLAVDLALPEPSETALDLQIAPMAGMGSQQEAMTQEGLFMDRQSANIQGQLNMQAEENARRDRQTLERLLRSTLDSQFQGLPTLRSPLRQSGVG